MLFHRPRHYPRVYAQYYEQLDFHCPPEAWLRRYEAVPERARNLFCVHWTHLEVHNGGFSQYFSNSTGVLAPEAVIGFRAIGLPEVAQVIAGAMERVGRPYPRDRSLRQRAVGVHDERLDFAPEDARFFELADSKSLFGGVPRFVPYAERYALGEGAY